MSTNSKEEELLKLYDRLKRSEPYIDKDDKALLEKFRLPNTKGESI